MYQSISYTSVIFVVQYNMFCKTEDQDKLWNCWWQFYQKYIQDFNYVNQWMVKKLILETHRYNPDLQTLRRPLLVKSVRICCVSYRLTVRKTGYYQHFIPLHF